tara:strand:+ start:2528 stop:3208 length:681 start_codon:yes stop_codon:yes gene_type:complete
MRKNSNLISKNKIKFIWFVVYLIAAAFMGEFLYKKQDTNYYTEIKVDINTTSSNMNNALYNIFEKYFYDKTNISKWKLQNENKFSSDEIFINFEDEIQKRSEEKDWYKKNTKIYFKKNNYSKRKTIVIKNPTIRYVKLIMNYVDFSVAEIKQDVSNLNLRYLANEFDQETVGPMILFISAAEPISKYRINFVQRSRHYVLSFIIFMILYVVSIIFAREAKDLLKLR